MAITVGGSSPAGMVGDDYQTELTAVGGNAPYTWAANSPLPNGLTLVPSQDGQRAAIQGKPTAYGSTDCTVNVTDSRNDTVSYEFHLDINPALAISTTHNLPSAVEGKRYRAAIDATGGSPPYKWALPNPPDGLTLDADTGAIVWPAPTSGTTRFAVHAADHDGHTDMGIFTLSIRRPRLRERLFFTSTWLALLALGIPIIGGAWIVIYAFATPGSH